MVLPGEGTQFEQGGTLAWTYETDDGFRIPWTRIGAYQGYTDARKSRRRLNLRNLYSRYTSGRFAEAVAGSGLSYTTFSESPVHFM